MNVLDIRLDRFSDDTMEVTLDRPPVGQTCSAPLVLETPLEHLHGLLAMRPDDVQLKAVGEELFRGLFPGKLGLTLQRNLDHAISNGGLRLQLDIRSRALAAIPWELLRRNDDTWPLALRNGLSITRYRELPVKPSGPVSIETLRLLYAGASPVDGPAPLNIVGEQRAMEDAVAHAPTTLMLSAIVPATLQALQSAFQRYQPHIVQFSAHGHSQKGTAGLLLADSYGDAHFIPGDKLELLVSSCETLRVVVLNACHSGAVNTSLLYTLSDHMLRGGVRLVIAMQGAVSERSAQAFSRGFIEALAQGETSEQAVYAGRQVIYQSASIWEWSLPIVLNTSSDAKLWQQRAVAPRPVVPPPHDPPNFNISISGNTVQNGIVAGYIGQSTQHTDKKTQS